MSVNEKPQDVPDVRHRHERRHQPASSRRQGFLTRWFLANSLISGFFALCWLVLRSGSKPSRFAYPCQQAALSAATLAFSAPVVAALLAARHGIAAALRRPAGVAVAALGLIVTAGMWGYASRADVYRGPKRGAPAGYRAQVYHVADCPQDPAGDRFLGLDNLLVLMGREGLKFYESSTTSLTAGPAGIIARDDVVVIKINYQWSERGGSNTDVLHGLIRRIVKHPDTFIGEVVVCENAQFVSVGGFDRPSNNAQDHALSPHDVVVTFQSEGRRVSHYDWTSIRFNAVNEYSELNMTDGYVLYPYDGALQGRVSYPKFQTDDGTYISLRDGIWDPIGGTYDREHLKFINLPVLKSHSIYGVTAVVKHHMGTVTGALSTNSHSAIERGILGALLGELQPADLNILDSVWINAVPQAGPGTSYGIATRRDELVASVDPVAADMWAVTNILVPAFQANGYSPGQYGPADPDIPTSDFRVYLDRSMNYILAAGYNATNDPAQIDAFTGDGGLGDFRRDGDVDLEDYDEFALCYTGPGGGPVGPQCRPGDFDVDDDVDCNDWDAFTFVWTDAVRPPGLLPCSPDLPAPPMEAPSPDNARKNRYISFVMDNVSSAAIQVEMTASGEFPGSTGLLGWVGEPDANNVSRVIAQPYYDNSWPPVVHLGDCAIVPVASYMLRATWDGVTFSYPLEIGTILKPGSWHYGDVVGIGTGDLPPLLGFTPPNGVVNVADVQALLLTIHSSSTPNAPTTWVDLHGLGDGIPPNFTLNVSDLQRILWGIDRKLWGESPEHFDPANCP